jgi:hypothetical protein
MALALLLASEVRGVAVDGVVFVDGLVFVAGVDKA